MDISHGLASSAAYVTTPNKLAVASLHLPDDVCVVTAAAAQEVASIRPLGSTVAFPSLRPGDSQFGIFNAVVGGLVDVQQIFFADWYLPLPFVFPAYLSSRPVGNLDAAFVLLFQKTANLCKGGHSLPARLESAGARDSVATAIHRHQLCDGLGKS